MPWKKPWKLCAAAACAALMAGVSACGSSSSGSGPNDPIVVMVMGTFQSAGQDNRDAAAAVQAKADAVNAAGGIKGRQLKVEVCDDQLNPNQATTCARNAVSDHAAVVISSTQSSGFGAQTLPVLQAAKIPVLGEPAVVAADWTSSNVFPLDPGEPAQYAGVALALKDAGCIKVGSVQLPVSSGAAAVDDLRTGLQALGMQLVKNIEVGMTEPSYAAQVAQLVGAGATCIVPIIEPSEVAKLVNATQQSGQKLIIGGVTAAFTQQLLTSLGAAGEGILLAGANYLPTDTQIPAVQEMIDTMKRYTPDTKPIDTYSTAAWGAATLLFSSLMPTINGTIDAASVMSALENSKNATVGTYAPYTFAKQPPAKDFPRLRNTGILTWKVQNTVPHLESTEFTDIYQAMPPK